MSSLTLDLYTSVSSQLSNLTIEDQEETQLPYAMRDVPPTSQLDEHQQNPGSHTPAKQVTDKTMTAMNGNSPSPSPSRTSSLPNHFPNKTPSSPTAPPRKVMQLASRNRSYSPISRPQSPWCYADPYDSPEASSSALPLFYSKNLKTQHFTKLYNDIWFFCRTRTKNMWALPPCRTKLTERRWRKGTCSRSWWQVRSPLSLFIHQMYPFYNNRAWFNEENLPHSKKGINVADSKIYHFSSIHPACLSS